MREKVESFDGIAGVARGDTLVTLWQRPATTERWRWQHERVENLAASRSDVVVVNFILSSSDPPDGALRNRMQADFRALGEKLRRIVVVPLGGTMWMSVVRTIVRATLLLSGQARRQSVAATVDDAVRRVAEVAGPETPSGAEIRGILAALSAELGAPLDEGARESAR